MISDTRNAGVSQIDLNKSLHDYITGSVSVALAEDVGTGDLTANLIPEAQKACAIVTTREDIIVAGSPWFEEVFAQLDGQIEVDWNRAEGERAAAMEALCTVTGPARTILTGERTALNFLQLLSATATQTGTYVAAIAGTSAVILDTRKTLPGLRLAQKYAVLCGGAQNHRIGLYDAILIKENHIVSAGSIQSAVTAAHEQNTGVLIEVEVETLDQGRDALRSGAHRLLLDNFELEELREAVRLRDNEAPTITLEASGGINLGNIRQVAETGVDFISVGALTKDVEAADLSMRFQLAA